MKTITVKIQPTGFNEAYRFLSRLKIEMPDRIQSIAFGDDEAIEVSGDLTAFETVMSALSTHLAGEDGS